MSTTAKSTDPWIERVRQADAEAERCWRAANAAQSVERALIAIAAELRAQRIARRPGAGQ